MPPTKKQKRSGKPKLVNGELKGFVVSGPKQSLVSDVCECGKCTVTTFLQVGCPKSSKFIELLPYVDSGHLSEDSSLMHRRKLYVEYKQICAKFSSLKSAIFKSISDRCVPVARLSHLLETMSAFLPPREHMPLFGHHLPLVGKAKKLDSLFNLLSSFSSFFNYSLIESVVSEVGSEEDVTELDKYKAVLVEYSKRNLFECPSYFTTLPDTFQNTTVLFKVNKDFSKLPIAQLEQFTDWLCNVFLISRSSVILSDVARSERCHVELVYPRLSEEIELSFSIPICARDKMLPVSQEQQVMLKTGGVLEIFSRDFHQVMISHDDTATNGVLTAPSINEHPTSSSDYFNNLTIAQAALLLNSPNMSESVHPTRNGHIPATSEANGPMLQTHDYADRGYMPPSSSGQFPSFSQSDIANQFLTMDRVGTSLLQADCAVSCDSDSDVGGTGKPKPKPAPGKKTRGRVKIPMKYIKNKLRRYTTFSKRKSNIMKKAYELSTLTGTQVMLMVASETGHVYTFATPKLQPMITSDAGKALIQTCLHQPDPPPSLLHTSSSEQFDVRMSSAGYEEVDLSAYKLPTNEQKSADRPPSSSSSSLQGISTLLPSTSYPSDIASLMPALSSYRPQPLSLVTDDYSPMKRKEQTKE